MNPKIYLVGGACRDILLGLTPKDRDYVVVGANHDWMIERGFQQVGLDFPVYLHPDTGDEYALARREKKVGIGYNGFQTETGPNLSPGLLQKFIDLGYDPSQEYKIEELVSVLQHIIQLNGDHLF